jgi:ADP-heptose:LPS heptosyltransferase
VKQVIRSLMLLLVRVLGAPGVAKAARKRREQENTRILLVRPDHLGDLILVTPVLKALKDQLPEAEITMLVGPWSREVMARQPELTRVETCVFPGFQRASQNPLAPYILLFRLARQLHKEDYDLAVNLRPDFWWGAAVLYLAGIPKRIGYALEPGKPFLTEALAFIEPEHASVSSLRLASLALLRLGKRSLEEPLSAERYPLHFEPTDEERKWVREKLKSEGIGPEEAVVVIHPGTGGAVKLWRPEGWAHCADWLMEEKILATEEVRVVLTGTPKERGLLEEIAQGMQGAKKVVLLSELSVGQLAALLGRAELVLGVDNGPLHLAVAQETLTLQLFGPTDVRIFGPWGKAGRHVVIASKQKCASCPFIPCGRLDFRDEELDEHPCVKVIGEQEVEEAIEGLVKKVVLG